MIYVDGSDGCFVGIQQQKMKWRYPWQNLNEFILLLLLLKSALSQPRTDEWTRGRDVPSGQIEEKKGKRKDKYTEILLTEVQSTLGALHIRYIVCKSM